MNDLNMLLSCFREKMPASRWRTARGEGAIGGGDSADVVGVPQHAVYRVAP